MKKILAVLLSAILALGILAGCSGKGAITIAVPNDTTNEARALLLLQENGYIKLKDGEVCTNFVKVEKSEPEIVLVSEAGRFLRFSAADIPEKKRGAGTVAGIAMKDGEKLSDVFFVWPEDVKKAVEAGIEEPPAGENNEGKNDGNDDVRSTDLILEAMPAGEKKMPVDETAAKGDSISTEEQLPAELILTLKNKKQIPFSKLAKAKRGGKGTLKKI